MFHSNWLGASDCCSKRCSSQPLSNLTCVWSTRTGFESIGIARLGLRCLLVECLFLLRSAQCLVSSAAKPSLVSDKSSFSRKSTFRPVSAVRVPGVSGRHYWASFVWRAVVANPSVANPSLAPAIEVHCSPPFWSPVALQDLRVQAEPPIPKPLTSAPNDPHLFHQRRALGWMVSSERDDRCETTQPRPAETRQRTARKNSLPHTKKKATALRTWRNKNPSEAARCVFSTSAVRSSQWSSPMSKELFEMELAARRFSRQHAPHRCRYRCQFHT